MGMHRKPDAGSRFLNDCRFAIDKGGELIRDIYGTGKGV